jgi:hypothetical protein
MELDVALIPWSNTNQNVCYALQLSYPPQIKHQSPWTLHPRFENKITMNQNLSILNCKIEQSHMQLCTHSWKTKGVAKLWIMFSQKVAKCNRGLSKKSWSLILACQKKASKGSHKFVIVDNNLKLYVELMALKSKSMSIPNKFDWI